MLLIWGLCTLYLFFLEHFTPRYFHISSPSSFRSWFKCLPERSPISTFHKITSLHTHTHSILILIFLIALPKLNVIFLTCYFLICFYLLQRGRKEEEKNSVMREEQWLVCCLVHSAYWGLSPQPRPCTLTRNQIVTSWFMGQGSITEQCQKKLLSVLFSAVSPLARMKPYI